MRALIQMAGNLNLVCRPLRLELSHLQQLRLPAILHWDMNHFVVLERVSPKEIFINDPAVGRRRFSFAEAAKHVTGVALELVPSPGFEPRAERVKLPLRAFWGRTAGIGHALLQILLLSVVLEALVIAAPFYMQLTVDEVIARGDVDFLMILALGFGLLMLIKVASTVIRSQIILIVQNTLHYQLGLRLFHHLLRLPLVYFEKRHIGDLLSRFTSVEPIRNLFAEGLIAAGIDGLMATATLAMLFIYSARLAVIVVTAALGYALLRLVLYRLFRERSQTVIQNKAREDSVFIETMRAMQSLKLFNREGERENQWLHRHADVVNANVALGRAKITFKMANDLIFGLENIAVIYFAVRLALDNVLTVGMIFAFVSYKTSFTEKAVLLVEKVLDFRILDLHLERLADIALSPPEPGHDQALTYQREIRGGIELRNVSFRYADSEPYVLENVNLTIEPGRFITITGPSGSGKTTLVKIMLGLLEPTSGEVLIDGTPLQTIGARAFREQVGAVMQEDQLLSGSIADNICFFDPAFDHEWMVECAQLAGIHDEIMAMPMAYNSLIGDMGSSLSGGQKQRVLLARALYRRPKILVLDEGTAHLDLEREQLISENLRNLDITRISIAHRPGVIDGVDAVFNVGAVKDRPAVRLATSPEPAATAASRSNSPKSAPDASTPTERTPSRRHLRAVVQGIAIVVLSGSLVGAAHFPKSDRLLNAIGDHAGRLVRTLLDELHKDKAPRVAQNASGRNAVRTQWMNHSRPCTQGVISSLAGNTKLTTRPQTSFRPQMLMPTTTHRQSEHGGAEAARKSMSIGTVRAVREAPETLPQTPPSAEVNDIREARAAPDAKSMAIPQTLSSVPTKIAPHALSSSAPESSLNSDNGRITSSKDDEKLLLERGDNLLRLGDIASARLFYERAVAAGSSRAATALGKTHDPAFLQQIPSLKTVKPDLGKAQYWYRQASEAGDTEAMERLRSLETSYPH